MDRDLAREDLVLAILESGQHAAEVRARLDSSQFGRHSALAMLVADHDLHRPDAPRTGPGRLDSITRYVADLAAASARADHRPGIGRNDPRWALVADARRSLVALSDQVPRSTDLTALLAAFQERRRGGASAPVPGPATESRRRRRGDGWRG